MAELKKNLLKFFLMIRTNQISSNVDDKTKQARSYIINYKYKSKTSPKTRKEIIRY